GAGSYLYSFSPDGAALWRLPVGTSFGTVLQAADGTLYATGATGTSNTVYQVDPDGTVLSRFTATGSFMSPLALALAADGTVYFGAGDALLAVDRLGNLRWRQSCLPGGRVNSSAAISAEGLIYYQAILPGGIPSATLCGTDGTGVIRWAHQTQYNGENGPQVS